LNNENGWVNKQEGLALKPHGDPWLTPNGKPLPKPNLESNEPSMPLSKKPYQVSQSMDSKYMIPDRVIGTSGSKIAPTLYVAIGLSGAVQHIAGMKESEIVISINIDENSHIVDESDIFIKGRMEDVIPKLVDKIKDQMQAISVRST